MSQSERSYGSLVQAGRDLAAATTKIGGYNPSAPDLQPAALAATMKALTGLNTNVATAVSAAGDAIDIRGRLYEHPETGLATQFQQAKDAVAAQFGRRSAQFKSVSGTKY